MSSDYSYDQEGQFFPFFILTLTLLVTVPTTWSLLQPTKDSSDLAPRIKSSYAPKHGDVVDSLRTAQKRKLRKMKRLAVVLIGWTIVALMVYLIMVTKRIAPKLWNPYDILGISESSNEKEIKAKYRRLTLKFHPDKVKPDPAKNETMESLNTKFVEITKAYQALTDDVVRNNYIQYGHPDGKQSFSIGIALPKFIVSGGNGKYIVLVYTLLLGVLLPYLVGSWWYGTQRMSKEGVLMESANNMFHEYDERIDVGGIVSAVSTGKEAKDALRGDDAEPAKIESKITSVLAAKDKDKLEEIEDPVRRKTLALLWAYLERVELDDDSLTRLKFDLGPIARSLMKAFTGIALAYGNTGAIMASYHAGQRVIQAMGPKSSPLLQLPHFTPAIASAVDGDSKAHMSLQEFMELPDAERRRLAVGKGLLTEDQYKTAVGVAHQLPQFSVAKAFFKVTGERFIIPSSLVSLVVKGRFIPPGSTNVPEVDPLDLEDVDPAEDDLDAITGRKRKIKGPDGNMITVDDEPVFPPLTFAPLYARDHSPRWHIFLTDSKQGKMAVPPFTFAQFDRPIFDESGKPTYNVQTLKAQFAAPPQPGRYTFVMHVVCDSYVGFDTKMEVTLHVEEASKAAEMVAEDEISEPDEDSLAGQMNALKSGNISGAPAKPKKKAAASESDDESGTDDDIEDDTSDTNTDTEDES